MTVHLRRLNLHGKWIYGSRRMSGHDEYKGSLLHEEGSPLQHVSVTLGFDTHDPIRPEPR
ncbi:hypothetical protein FV226_16435 [Methylobacterium sp. WL12]|uniref:hypothetical protein n=1 Tax=Methylobacterium sp. WL12 TaxID=2603890 RepID=UPI0011CCDB02|nr:hypothetical protein [Methylobacterium sp. WL12]TXM70758.1 hypothetical protein FV226_16435 [Methylobacterium sp. WL12]